MPNTAALSPSRPSVAGIMTARGIAMKCLVMEDVAIDSEAQLIAPQRPGLVSNLERVAIAHHVAALLGDSDLEHRYRRVLAEVSAGDDAIVALVLLETARAATAFPARYRISDARRAVIGDRLAEAFGHVHAVLSGAGRVRALPQGWDREGVEILASIVSLVRLKAQVLTEVRQHAEARRVQLAAG